MKELRRRICKTFERQKRIFEDAIKPMSDAERNIFIDRIYNLPGVTAYINQKSADFDEASGETFGKFVDRHFNEYKTEYEKRNKAKICRSNSVSKN